jgi:hypothetical protein
MSIRRGIWPGRRSEAGEDGYDGPIFGKVPEEWMKYFKFTFVRHPMDRFLSAYRYYLAYHNYKGSVEEFAKEALNPHMPLEDYRSIKHHTFPQTHPLNCLQHADFVGRFENYAEDLEKILKTVGKKPPAQLPHKHKTEPAPICIPEETKQALIEYYAEDFEELGYTP